MKIIPKKVFLLAFLFIAGVVLFTFPNEASASYCADPMLANKKLTGFTSTVTVWNKNTPAECRLWCNERTDNPTGCLWVQDTRCIAEWGPVYYEAGTWYASTCALPVDAVCGSNHISNLCNVGNPYGNVANYADQWQWHCQGLYGGSNTYDPGRYPCYEMKPVNAVCSSSHYGCSPGTSVNNVDGSTSWTWKCNGSYGGSNASCSQMKPVNAVCGSNHISNLCTAGTLYGNVADYPTQWQWNCHGLYGGSNTDDPGRYPCYQNKPVPPTPSVSVTPICTPTNTSSMYTISWTATSPAITWVAISEDSTFSTGYYHKQITSGTSTSASTGFTWYNNNNTLTLQPNKTYYVKIYNGYLNSPSATFTTPVSCTCNGNSAVDNPPPDQVTTFTVGTTVGLQGWGAFCSGPNGTNMNRVDLYYGSGGTWKPQVASINSYVSRPNVVASGWTCGSANPNNDGWEYNWTVPNTPGNFTFRAVAINDSAANCQKVIDRNIKINPLPPPTPSVSVTPICTPTNTSSMYTISWTATSPAITWVAISEDSTFSTGYYHKQITSGTSTSASTGFTWYNNNNTLTLQPNKTYYVKIYNGYLNSASATFTTPVSCDCAGDIRFDTVANNTTLTAGETKNLAGWATFCSGPNGTNRDRVDLHLVKKPESQNDWLQIASNIPSVPRPDLLSPENAWTCANLNPNNDGWSYNWTVPNTPGNFILRTVSINDAPAICQKVIDRNITIISPPTPTSIQPTPTTPPTPLDANCPYDGNYPLRMSSGLLSTKENTNQISTTDYCIISKQANILSSFIPSYDEMKAIYYDKSKLSKTTIDNENKIQIPAQQQKLFSIAGDLTLTKNINVPNGAVAVIFVVGNLTINANQTVNNPLTSGLVFVVSGNVNIAPNVTEISAVTITSGTFCSAALADGTCDTSTQPLAISGSVISLNASKPPKFVRSLVNNSNPAETITYQPKYLVILKNIFSRDLTVWKEIQ